MIKSFDEVLDFTAKRGSKTIAVACAHDGEVMIAVDEAKKKGIVNAILVGDGQKIEQIASDKNIDLVDYEILDIKDLSEACLKAVELVSTGKAHMVMKGIVDTFTILIAVLNSYIGLRTADVLSHVAVLDIESLKNLYL